MLKLSGEALGAAGGRSFEPSRLGHITTEIAEVAQAGVSLAIVIGAGNLVRGRDITDTRVDRLTADAAGIYATIINGLVLAGALEQRGVPAALFSAVGAGRFVSEYATAPARDALDNGRVTLCVGGTGNPYFTTDTAAALRAVELGADALLKGTKVDGVYSADPNTCDSAQRFDRLTYRDVIDRSLEVMDLTAVSLCRENRLPIAVFNVFEKGNLLRATRGEAIGTLVTEEDVHGH